MRFKCGILLTGSIFGIVALFCFFYFVSAVEAETDNHYPTVKLFGFTHIWAQYDDTANEDSFDVARARVGIQGDLTSRLNYMVLTEWGRLAYDDPVSLLDAWINLRFSPAFNVKLGQTWYKFTISGTQILPKIPFIFRPEVIDGIWLPMGRNGSYAYDQGLEFWGEFEEGTIPWKYFFSVTNGSGLDNFDDNGKKDYALRVAFEPKEGLSLGLNGFYGHSRVDVLSNISGSETRDLPEYIYGAEFSYAQKYYRVMYEYLEGLYEGYLNITGSETFHIATKKPRGWYAMLGWKPFPQLEIPVRYAWYEKDATNSETGLAAVTTGLTWFFKEGSLNNIKLNYIIREAEDNYGSDLRNKIAFQMQFVF